MAGRIIGFICYMLCAIPFWAIAKFGKDGKDPISFWSGDPSLKGRVKDSEIAEHAENKQPYQFRKPAFTAPTGDSRVYGNVMHKAMQYIRFENCVDFDSVSTEIKRMVSEGILTEAESAKVDIVGIAAFFTSDVGTRIRSAKKGSVLREFKFSLLDDASRYADGLENENVTTKSSKSSLSDAGYCRLCYR